MNASDREPSDSAKRSFGARLRGIRLDASITGAELASRCGWNKSKVSKIEHGNQAPSDTDIRAWTVACGAEAQASELIALGREIGEMWRDYKQVHKRGMKNIQLEAMDLYARTKLVRIYESVHIPGWLQTLDYTRSQFAMSAKIHGLPPDDMEEAAQNRMLRKKFLGTGRPRFVFVIEELALCNNIGGRSVMNAQLDYLIEVGRMPYVSIGIIPLGLERSLFSGEGFYMYDDTLLWQEFWSASFETARAENIAHFSRVFDALKEHAVFGSAAERLIDRARRHLL